MLNRQKPHVTYTLLLANIDEKPWLVAMDVVEAELFAQLCPECESPLLSNEACSEYEEIGEDVPSQIRAITPYQ